MGIPENQREEYIAHMKAQEDANKIISKIFNYINFNL